MSEILFVSLLSGLSTALGGILVTFYRKPKEQWLALLLGIAAGVMLAVVIFDLVPAALLYGGSMLTLLGFLLGCFILWLLDLLMTKLSASADFPHNRPVYFRKLGYLIALGIALHDLPEGMAIAIGFETTQSLGVVIALAVALHNIPEGMATAAPLVLGRVSNRSILLITLLISLVTPLGTFCGILLAGTNKSSIAVLLAFAAGAMLYIVQDELLPALKSNHVLIARFGLVCGFTLIMALTISGLS